MTEMKYKRATVKIPTISDSHATIKLRKDNERLIRHIERLENGPFGKKVVQKGQLQMLISYRW